MQLELEDIPTVETPPEEPHSKTLSDLPRLAVLFICISMLATITAFAIPYFVLSRRVDRQLASGTFQHTLNYYSAPEIVSLGDPMPDAELVGALKRSGYSVTATGKGITFHTKPPDEIKLAHRHISSNEDLDNRRLLRPT